MQTREQLLQEMLRLGACYEATEYVRSHPAEDALTIGLKCDRVGWLIWYIGRKDPAAIAGFAKRCADRWPAAAAAAAYNDAAYASAAAAYAAHNAAAAAYNAAAYAERDERSERAEHTERAEQLRDLHAMCEVLCGNP
jgi:hypothetical protein